MRLPSAVLSAVLAVPLVGACSGPQGSGPTTTAPRADPTASPTTPPTAAELWDSLVLGRPPAVGHTVDGVHVAPDGTGTRLPGRGGISAVTPSDLGLLVADASFFEATNGLRLVTASGAEALSGGSTSASADRAW